MDVMDDMIVEFWGKVFEQTAEHYKAECESRIFRSKHCRFPDRVSEHDGLFLLKAIGAGFVSEIIVHSQARYMALPFCYKE